jgi:hypothetical protein
VSVLIRSLFILVFSVTCGARAAVLESRLLGGQALWSEQAPSKKPVLSLFLLNSEYLSPALTPEETNHSLSGLPRLFIDAQKPSGWSWLADFRSVLPLSRGGESHALLPEAFVERKQTGWAQGFGFGRKLDTWSRLDRQLGLGVWQPLFRWDHARPVEMGLTGLTYERALGPRFSIKGLISPLFLPDQQSDFENDNGAITSTNRWFRAPISSVSLGHSEGEILFNIVKPEVADVVLNPSFVGRLDYSEGQEGFFGTVAVADKPANQLHVAYDKRDSVRLDLGDSNQIDVPVYPVVVRHRLLTVEAGLKQSAYELFLSHTTERMQVPSINPEWDQVPLNDSSYQGLSVRHPVTTQFSSLDLDLTWSYARRQLRPLARPPSRFEGDFGPQVQRLPFKELAAVQLDFKSELKKSREISGRVAFNYSPVDNGQWVAADMNFAFTRNWLWYLGLDILGAREGVTSEDASFAAIYRNNDRVQGGFTYVF